MLGAPREGLADYRFDLASQLLYDFIWNEYCDWYLESLRALHPFMPFITEEIWQNIAALAGVTGETIMLQPFPRHDASKLDRAAEADIDWLKEFSLAVRAIRGEMNIPPGKRLPLLLREGDEEDRRRIQALSRIHAATRWCSLTGLARWWRSARECNGLCGKLEILVPLEGLIDRDAELARLDKEI
jgi:valyl-tRNA synthetase